MRSRRCSHSRETPAASRNVSSRDGSVTGGWPRKAVSSAARREAAISSWQTATTGRPVSSCSAAIQCARAIWLTPETAAVCPASSMARSDSYSGLLCSRESRTFMDDTSKTGLNRFSVQQATQVEALPPTCRSRSIFNYLPLNDAAAFSHPSVRMQSAASRALPSARSSSGCSALEKLESTQSARS